MANIFLSIYQFFKSHKLALWLVVLASFAITGWLASRLNLLEDITHVLPQDKKIEHLQQFLQSSKFSDKLVLIISQKDSISDPDQLISIAESLTTSFQDNRHIASIEDKVDESLILDQFQAIREQIPVYLEEKDYTAIDSLITEANIKSKLSSNYNLLISPAGAVMKNFVMADPLGISMIGISRLQDLQVDTQFELFDGYVMTKDLQNLLYFVIPVYTPGETGKNLEFLEELDITLDSLTALYPGQEIQYFGTAAVAAGNAKQLRRDTLLTQGSTVLILVLLIFLFFRKKRAPFLVMLPVIFGAFFSLAVIYLIQGEISVIALAAGSVVLGIAVNYSLHVYNHYRHSTGIRQVIEDLSIPMTVGSISTIGGFLCLQFVKSPMLQDIGLVACFSLTGAVLFSLIILPHLITIGSKPHTPAKENVVDFISQKRLEGNKWLVGSMVLLTILFLFSSQNVRFESDMMKLNFMAPHLREAEEKLNSFNDFTSQTMYLISEGKDLDEALQNRDRIRPVIQNLIDSGAILKVSGTGGLLISAEEQQARIERWNNYWTPEKKTFVLNTLAAEGQSLSFKPEAFDAFQSMLSKDYGIVEPAESSLLSGNLLSDYVNEKDTITSVTSFLKVDPQQRMKVYAALEGLQDNTVFDKAYTVNRLAEIIKEEFNSLAWMTGTLVFLVLLIAYGRIELALITFIPMFISWIWILGIMGLLDIPFNLVNIILSTFIFGLGDDYSIFTMDGLKQEYKTGNKFLPSFKSSIFFSAITTILGLGVLIFAEHPSLRSIALIAVIGICSVVLTSQVLIPLFFKILISNRIKKGRNPGTFFGWLVTFVTFGYFAFGSLLLTLIGILLLKVIPFFKKQSKYIYHWILSKFTKSLLLLAVIVRKEKINIGLEDFKKPAVIIANHQSFLDILMLTAMHPKVILLTNHWVYHSPVFGYVVRMADYYPVMEGAESSVDRLRDKVNDGFSIVIFPEGTRAADCKLKRFHKGAFFIAESLKLDIIPIILHGTGHTLPKGDFFVKKGKVTMKILPRIKHDDLSWGENYSLRCKKISAHFKQEFKQLSDEIETPAYFRTKLYSNYIYKSPILENYLKIKLKMEDNYAIFHELLPIKGKIMDIGCGYGFLSYMLSFLSEEREILGVDYDEEKIATAQHAYSKTERMQFVATDIMTYEFQNQDAFVLMDVIHYLEPESQEALLEKCIHHLNPGGIILLRDGVTDIGKQHKRTLLSEFFSTKILGFNKKGSQPLSFTSFAIIKNIVEKNGASIQIHSESLNTSNVLFIIKPSMHGHAAGV
jgi:1-acyl-sn-glycerol-3-phosphate acyltransferase